MRIAYYVPETLLRHSGIHNRVQATLRAWVRLGHEGVLLRGPWASPWGLLGRHLESDGAVATRALAQLHDGAADHVHLRLFLPTRRWLQVARTGQLSIEVHNRLRRPESRRDTARVVLGWQVARRLAAASACGAFVTQELADLPEYARTPRRVAIGNGVELSAPYPAPCSRRPRIGMAIGSNSAWHGLDQFARLAEAMPDVDYAAIAPTDVATHLPRHAPVSLIATSGRDEYEQALASLDGAIGSLAMHRAHLTEAAPLKVRDYVRAGIPTVLPYRDTNLSFVDDECLLDISNKAIDVAQLRGWIHRVHGKRVSEAARTVISIDVVEAHRLEELRAAHLRSRS